MRTGGRKGIFIQTNLAHSFAPERIEQSVPEVHFLAVARRLTIGRLTAEGV